MRYLITLAILATGINGYTQDFIFDTFPLNSYADDNYPVLSPDGSVLFFTRSHHEDNVNGRKDKGDIYYSILTDSVGWLKPAKLEGVNNEYLNSILDINNNRLFIYGEYLTGKPPLPGLSVVKATDWPTDWAKPEKQEIKYFKNLSANLGVSLSNDGQIMIISMESYKSRGVEDLYVCFKNGNGWTEPKNLGSTINTPLQELTPFLAADNKTLFFASNGHEGYGSRDIFVTQRQDDSWTSWSVPENLGVMVNTEGAEMGYRLYPELSLAVFSSTKDSDGYGDIQIIPVEDFDAELIAPIENVVPEVVEEIIQVENPEIAAAEEGKVVLKGRITDSTNGERVFARTKLIDGDEVSEHFNDSTYFFPVEPNQEYILQIDAEGYISKNLRIEPFTINLSKDILLDPIEVGTTVNLENVLFVRGTTDLVESSFKELDLVVQMMKNNPTMEIELSGHTDNVGVASLNQRLSQERVDAVIAYLAEMGIDKSRLSGKGYGGSKPIASNANETTRRLNRRVEFTIIHQ